MRLAPLAPLALLALGALLVEALRLDLPQGAASEARMTVSDASVALAVTSIKARFSTPRLRLDSAGASAQAVRGSMATSDGSTMFAADQLEHDAASGQAQLLGNVFISDERSILRTDRALLDADGGISGDQAQVEADSHRARIGSFRMTAGGDLFIGDGITLRISQ